MPSDSDVSLKIFEKLRKYKDLEVKVTKTWHLKTTTLPVVIGALGMVAKTALNYVSEIPGAPPLTLMGTTQYPANGTINVTFFNIKIAFSYLSFLNGTWYGSYKH